MLAAAVLLKERRGLFRVRLGLDRALYKLKHEAVGL